MPAEAPAPAFEAVLASMLDRRRLLGRGLAGTLAALFCTALPVAGLGRRRAQAASLLGFRAVATGVADTVTVPPGYRMQVLVPWGEPIAGTYPRFRPDNSGAEQAMQMGMHHDGMHFFPIDGSSTDGFLVINHEYVEPRLLHAAAAGSALDGDDVPGPRDARAPEQALKEINAHGVSVVRVARGLDGLWTVQRDPRNRRVTGLTPARFSGPVAGTAFLHTRYSPDGTRVRGTLNNCAGGATPWNTYLTAEENWAGYFRNGDRRDGKPDLPREQRRYGVPTEASRYRWERVAGGGDAFARFDASATGNGPAEDYRNEPNGFGWMVEIDPFDPDAMPVKRTALGRFGHEGIVFAPAVPGRPVVCYSGDDARFEHIYKAVGNRPYDPATADGSLLDDMTLYVARFDPDGTGTWLPLVFGQGGLTPENGFASQADILVNARSAADRVGATKMDRPEWGAVDPRTGMVYFALTNNTRRTAAQTDAANPRANNVFGHVLRWAEAGGDHAATRFDWSIFLLGGDAESGRGPDGRPLGPEAAFGSPDGLWFDPQGRLWIQTDIGESDMYKGVNAAFGNNQMLAADPGTGDVRRFLVGPVGQEITGIAMTPDGRTMFVNIQHPGATTTPEDFAAGRLASHWPDGGGRYPRSATVVIAKEDGGVIGS
ncbi:MAG: PhoX family phosphatase [Alphaproteobacteria bacterium]